MTVPKPRAETINRKGPPTAKSRTEITTLPARWSLTLPPETSTFSRIPCWIEVESAFADQVNDDTRMKEKKLHVNAFRWY